MIVKPVEWPAPAIWRQVGGLLKKSIDRTDGDTIESVVAELEAGTALLWIIHDDHIRAALVTRARETRDGPAIEYWHLGGQHAATWFPMMAEAVEAEGRRIGCVKAVTACRLGWQRIAKDYRPVAVALEKRL